MDFIKSRWSTTNGNNVEVNQSQAIDTSYNAVNYSNAPNNPIIISTQQHPAQVSIIRETRNPQMKVSDMTSPTESFHSVASSFHNDKRDGRVNLAFNGSNSEVNNHQQQQQQQQQSQHPQHSYVYVRYWAWHWPWSQWNQREKIFLLVIVILSLCILSLTSVLSVVLQKNIVCRDLLLSTIGINIPPF